MIQGTIPHRTEIERQIEIYQSKPIEARRENVVVMKAIVPTVSKAISLANVDLKQIFSLPFPAQGHQKEYANGLRGILLSNTPGVVSHPITAVTRPGQ